MKDTSGIIFETVTVGKHTKMTVIDPVTGTEVSMVVDPKLSKKHLQEFAIRKLEYVLKKNNPPPLQNYNFDKLV
jgi:predicted metal-dependent hydrolase